MKNTICTGKKKTLPTEEFISCKIDLMVWLNVFDKHSVWNTCIGDKWITSHLLFCSAEECKQVCWAIREFTRLFR